MRSGRLLAEESEGERKGVFSPHNTCAELEESTLKAEGRKVEIEEMGESILKMEIKQGGKANVGKMEESIPEAKNVRLGKVEFVNISLGPRESTNG